MKPGFTTYVGIDLGGARGKTTALAQLRLANDGTSAWVDDISTRRNGEPWVDDTLCEHLASLGDTVVVAMNAPLAVPACVRCTVPVCPGVSACVDPAVVWLRTEGQSLSVEVTEEVALHASRPSLGRTSHRHRIRISPYLHRATDLVLCYERGLIPPSALGSASGAIAARAGHVRRRLSGVGFTLDSNLIEVSPVATVAALFGPRRARGYKRDADPWETRAGIVEALGDLQFAPTSRLAREEVLRNDHCFDALIAGYTAFLWARDGWTRPAGVVAEDGWVWAPPSRPRR